MHPQTLIENVSAPDPAFRLQAARILGFVEEVEGLGPIRNQFKGETETEVKSALEWAGKRIFQAKQNGFSTQAAVYDYFNVYAEVTFLTEKNSGRAIQQIEENMRTKSTPSGGNMTTAAMAGFVMGGLIGATLTTHQARVRNALAQSQASLSGDDLDPDRRLSRRTKAIIPSETNPKPLGLRLLNDPDPRQRIAAASDLAMLNNPAALPYLAQAFLSDPDEEVQIAAEVHGKRLYWQLVYYQMEQDGTVQAYVDAKLKAAGIDPKKVEISADPKARQASPEEVAAILARAEAEKARKRRR